MLLFSALRFSLVHKWRSANNTVVRDLLLCCIVDMKTLKGITITRWASPASMCTLAWLVSISFDPTPTKFNATICRHRPLTFLSLYRQELALCFFPPSSFCCRIARSIKMDLFVSLLLLRPIRSIRTGFRRFGDKQFLSMAKHGGYFCFFSSFAHLLQGPTWMSFVVNTSFVFLMAQTLGFTICRLWRTERRQSSLSPSLREMEDTFVLPLLLDRF